MSNFPTLIPAFTVRPSYPIKLNAAIQHGADYIKTAPDGSTVTGALGDAVSVVSFEVGSKELAAMEEKIYVGSGQFIIESGKPVIVEYKVSEVSA
ncbi:hypothetical protein N0V88_004039 [Collariella sp. IMI 366227]|nr:hypothetical protein N0V88_004039 [Collariella sp. IMI 366227]